MNHYKENEPFIDSQQEGCAQAVDRAYNAYLKRPQIKPVCDRANEAMEDYLDGIPGSLYRLMKEDIGRVWGLLESPIEQVAIFQLAAINYGRADWPIYSKIARERGAYSHKHYPVQIIPQVVFGPFRVDFLFDLGSRGLFAIECDGEQFHQDKAKDSARDLHLLEHHNVKVLRIPGKHIWRSNESVALCADVVRAYLK